jgi:hypothetical protein
MSASGGKRTLAEITCGGLYRTKVALSDLPNDHIGIEDLERVGITLNAVQALWTLP